MRFSIARKLMLYVTLLLFLCTAVTTYVAVREESGALKEGLIQSARQQAVTIANSTESAFWSLNWLFVERMLREAVAASSGQVMFARVVKPEGEVYLADDPSVYGTQVDSSLLEKKASLVPFLLPRDGEKGLILTHPFLIQEDHWFVQLGLSLEPVRKASRLLILRNTAGGVVLLLIAVLVTYALSRRITRPLIRLSGAAERISLGHLDQEVEVSSGDEVGSLARAFNRMTGDLNRALQELKASERQARSLVSTAAKAGIGIAVIQNQGPARGKIKFVNQAVVDLSGYTQEELLDMTIADLIHPASLEEAWALFLRPAGEIDGRRTYRFNGRDKEGRDVPFEISVGVTENDGRKALVCYVKDIREELEAERKLAEYSANLEKEVHKRTLELETALEELKHTHNQLMQSEKMASIGQLAAGVAHEINNPVGFVLSNLGTLDQYCEDISLLLSLYDDLESALDGASPVPGNGRIPALLERLRDTKRDIDLPFLQEDHRKLIEESVEGVNRVSKIVSDLKDFVHVDKAEFVTADINQGIESTLNIVWNELKYKAEVVRELGDIPPVRCCPGRLNQVFMNLLVNAAQAIEGEGTIRIETRAAGDGVEVLISDTGCGIPKDAVPRIFDPFFTTKDVGKGTGLGLNVVYQIVESHGGTIHVESEVGKGTTFTIRLHREPPQEQHESAAQKDSAAGEGPARNPHSDR